MTKLDSHPLKISYNVEPEPHNKHLFPVTVKSIAFPKLLSNSKVKNIKSTAYNSGSYYSNLVIKVNITSNKSYQ